MTRGGDKYPAPLHVYEGTDSDSDEYITSGRAYCDVKEKEMQAMSRSSQYDARRQSLVRSHVEHDAATRHPEVQQRWNPQPRRQGLQYSSPQRKMDSTPRNEMERKLPDFGSLTQGELAPEGEAFVAFALVKKYADMFIGKANHPKVSEAYFNGGKLCQRNWDFFYIYRLKHDQNLKPIVLVPTSQFLHFLDVVNEDLGTKLSIPSGNRAFSIIFTNHRTPRPRYLGKSNTQAAATRLSEEVPPTYYKRPGEPVNMEPTNAEIDAFQAKILLMTETQAATKKANREKKTKSQLNTRKEWSNSIKRVQRYMGLRQNCKFEHLEEDWSKVPNSEPKKFDPEAPPPFTQEKDAVFICVDIEAWEESHNIITEIGIATLDTRDLANLAPDKALTREDGNEVKGCDGPNWRAAIRARHFRIHEHRHYRNSKHVRDCPDRFDYGSSEWISLKDAPSTIASCFKYPFSNPDAPQLNVDEVPEKRNIILVGHDLGGDIDYMRKVGYNVHNLAGLIDHIDTKYMWQYVTRDIQGRRLVAVLADLGLVGWNPHNAGNDAVYTLHVMIGIAFKHLKEREERGAMKEKMLEEAEKRVAEAVEKARKAAKEREEGWSSDGGGSDGGEGVKPVAKAGSGEARKPAATKRPQSSTWGSGERGSTFSPVVRPPTSLTSNKDNFPEPNWGSSKHGWLPLTRTSNKDNFPEPILESSKDLNTYQYEAWGSNEEAHPNWGPDTRKRHNTRGNDWQGTSKGGSGLGKGLGELSLNEKPRSKSPRSGAKSAQSKSSKSSKSSKGDDWGKGKGGDTYGW